MHIRCPHCENKIEIAFEETLTDVTCASCGSQVTLEATTPTETLKTAESFVGQFELLNELGAGTFGSVWKARDTQIGRLVAIKIPRNRKQSEGERNWQLAEARAAGQLNHPNIVSVYEIGIHEESIYIVAEFVDGINLKQKLKLGMLSTHDAAKLLLTVARAVAHAHEHGVIHRDLKPENILMNSEGAPLITDFGLARRDTAELTITTDGTILGTLCYMSPEQAAGKSHLADARSDIYSLGGILYELLTGAVPFRGENQLVIYQVRHEEPVPPRKRVGTIPRDLETICLKCLEKKSERRYATSSALADDLEAFLDGRPITARPVGRLGTLTKWAKRRPASAMLVLCSILLVSVLTIGGPIMTLQMLENRAAAREQLDSQIEMVLTAKPLAGIQAIDALEGQEAIARELINERLHSDADPPPSPIRARAALVLLGDQTREVLNNLVAGIDSEASAETTFVSAALLRFSTQSDEHSQELLEIVKQQASEPDIPLERSVRLLAVAVVLGDEGLALTQLESNEDPTFETLLVHELPQWSYDLSILSNSVSSYQSSRMKRVICFLLGQIESNRLDPVERDSFLQQLINWRDDPDPGLHSAARWTLSKWQNDEQAARTTSNVNSTENWFVNSIGLTLVRIQADSVTLGEGGGRHDKPQKLIQAEIERDFYIADREVTMAMYQKFVDAENLPPQDQPQDWTPDRSVSPSSNCPAQSVSVLDAMKFCNWLSRQENRIPYYETDGSVFDPSSLPQFEAMKPFPLWTTNRSSNGYRLPEFAEWELATRAGARTEFFFGNGQCADRLSSFAWYLESSRDPENPRAHDVGMLMPNRNGLFDVLGNVWELCSDYPFLNTAGEQVGLEDDYKKVIYSARGGAFSGAEDSCQSAAYLPALVTTPFRDYGFRIVLNQRMP